MFKNVSKTHKPPTHSLEFRPRNCNFGWLQFLTAVKHFCASVSAALHHHHQPAPSSTAPEQVCFHNFLQDRFWSELFVCFAIIAWMIAHRKTYCQCLLLKLHFVLSLNTSLNPNINKSSIRGNLPLSKRDGKHNARKNNERKKTGVVVVVFVDLERKNWAILSCLASKSIEIEIYMYIEACVYVKRLGLMLPIDWMRS